MTVKLLTEHHLEFLSLKGGCTGSSESTLVKMPHCYTFCFSDNRESLNKNLLNPIALRLIKPPLHGVLISLSAIGLMEQDTTYFQCLTFHLMLGCAKGCAKGCALLACCSSFARAYTNSNKGYLSIVLPF